MSNRLPKQFWRVVVLDTDRIKVYDRGSKTYAAEGHALRSQKEFAARGIRSEVWTTGPVQWECVSAPAPDNMDPLF